MPPEYSRFYLMKTSVDFFIEPFTDKQMARVAHSIVTRPHCTFVIVAKTAVRVKELRERLYQILRNLHSIGFCRITKDNVYQIELDTGALIVFNVNKPDQLKGRAIAGIWFDDGEYDEFYTNIWPVMQTGKGFFERISDAFPLPYIN